MALYLYGTTALDVMRYLRATNDGLIPGVPSRPRKLGDAVHSNRQLGLLSNNAEHILAHTTAPFHALVPKRNLVTKTDRLVTHLWSHDVPGNAYLNLKNGLFLPAPTFLFQQLANELNEIELARLGLELCGFYSKWAFPHIEMNATIDDEFNGCTFSLEPITTVTKLTRYLENRSGEQGRNKALRALHHVLDHSASPMESATYLLLCLPKRLGGQGLPSPILNAKVSVTTSVSTTLRYPDLYWPSSALDVEYDSDADHSGMWSRYKDSKRMVELAAENITVLPLTRSQLMDSTEFLSFATSVRRNLRVRARKQTPEWYNAYLDLRKAVLFPSE